MPPEISFVVASPNDVTADPDFAELYRNAFPREEQEPLDVIARSVAAGYGLVLLAREGGKTIGLATAHLVRDPPMVFLVYLAIAPASRRRGSGARLFEELVRRCGSHGGFPPPLVWEVDAPARAPNESERARRLARIEFFRRLGGEVWLETYLQPPVNGPSPVPMLLMGRAAAGVLRPPLEQIVRGIYFEKYGGANGIDRTLLEKLIAPSLGGPGAG